MRAHLELWCSEGRGRRPQRKLNCETSHTSRPGLRKKGKVLVWASGCYKHAHGYALCTWVHTVHTGTHYTHTLKILRSGKTKGRNRSSSTRYFLIKGNLALNNEMHSRVPDGAGDLSTSNLGDKRLLLYPDRITRQGKSRAGMEEAKDTNKHKLSFWDSRQLFLL